ncbi:RteC protein [Kaistella flava (ex Peng et al. 2021)]|uniref:RteC protein n=1 Tax=Kaistella flava (ex Peng et al. 2021) TaxID=2038776 RepID=A0A7M2Y6X6_9FLAO|nr:RteC domain-containing protein [Kaistella flava (ex Peng et al. 2021)]QOW09911.1 RteC protein [Kaistella flava (ex Peng et al. 2021)]
MITKTVFRKIHHVLNKLNSELVQISEEQENVIFSAEFSLMKIDEAIREVKSLISEHRFECVADEVLFFKTQKPLFISKFIYFSKILTIEASKPVAGQKEIKKHYLAELAKLKQYHIDNKDFHNYYLRNATYLDHKYFVRKSYDLKMELSPELYNFDENFTTSHDNKVAFIMANEFLEIYLINSINNIGLVSSENKSKFPLVWSASKVSLVELLYALYLTRSFNGGNIEFTEVIKAIEKLFEIDLGNSYKTIAEIRNRKNGRTKFLQLLNDNLNQLFLDSDK